MTIADHIYAQPLYWRESGGRASPLLARERDGVNAFGAPTGVGVLKIASATLLHDFMSFWSGACERLSASAPLADMRRWQSLIATQNRL